MSGDDAECPICVSVSTASYAVLHGLPLVRCRDCGHRFLRLETPSTVEVIYNDHYAGFREDPVFERQAARLVASELVPRVPPPAPLLDVGCGNGAFLSIARDAGYRSVGVDVSPAAGERCRSRGLDVRVGDLRSDAVVAPEEQYGLITFWDVVEHLPDPASFLARAHQLLARGGIVVVKTPRTSRASAAISARIPRVAGALLQAPSHVHYFREDDLRALLRRSGFATVDFVSLGAMRSSATGGSLRKRVARRALRTFQRVVGDGNLLAIARKA